MTTSREKRSAARRRRIERARVAGMAFWNKVSADADQVTAGGRLSRRREGVGSEAAASRWRRGTDVADRPGHPAVSGRSWLRSLAPDSVRDYLAGLLTDCRPAETAPENLFEELCDRLGREPDITEQLRGITASLADRHGPMIAARCTLELIDALMAPFPCECRTDGTP